MDNIQFEIVGDATGFYVHQVITAVVDAHGMAFPYQIDV